MRSSSLFVTVFVGTEGHVVDVEIITMRILQKQQVVGCQVRSVTIGLFFLVRQNLTV